MKEKRNKQKIKYIDDGSTVSDMNVEGMPWYVKGGYKKRKPEKLTLREKLSVFFGAYRAYLPFLLVVILSLGIMFLLFWLWWGL